MLHGVFKRAVRDRVIGHNPCADTELPKVVPAKVRILAPEEFDRLLAQIPAGYRALVLTAIETGLRWGELIALRPRHVDFLRRLLTVEETIVEVSKRHSPSGEQMTVKPYPKDNEPRTVWISPTLVEVVAARIEALNLGRGDLLFPPVEKAGGVPMSRNTFRTKVWLPALERADLGSTCECTTCDMRMHLGSWLAERTSRRSWIASGTVRSRPPRSTCIRYLTPTTRQSQLSSEPGSVTQAGEALVNRRLAPDLVGSGGKPDDKLMVGLHRPSMTSYQGVRERPAEAAGATARDLGWFEVRTVALRSPTEHEFC
jgi:hypothetical protein